MAGRTANFPGQFLQGYKSETAHHPAGEVPSVAAPVEPSGSVANRAVSTESQHVDDYHVFQLLFSGGRE